MLKYATAYLIVMFYYLIKKEFFESMDDDFNTPKAIASVFGLINDTKNELDDLSDDDKIAIKAFLDDVISSELLL